MSVQSFLLRQAMKWKMRKSPAARRDETIALVEKDPELFKKIGEEIERRKKGGVSEMKATMEVMRKYRGELTKLQQR